MKKTLFDQAQLGQMTLKNRLIRSATWERMADDDGSINTRLLNLYEDLAKGGVGMIITGYAFVTDQEQPNPRMMGISDDRFIAGYQQLTERVHRYDSKIVMQIAYGGSQTRFETEQRVIWGPSAVTHPRTGVTPRAMTQGNITELIEAFASAAERAQKAGFDGVEIHGAHGYLLSQFLSPYFNRRTDSYGGSIKNRARIIFEIYEAMRQRVGKLFSIMIKINCSDFSENGFTLEECSWVCRELAALGMDAIEISGSTPPGTKPSDECILAPYASRIAEQVKIPVIAVGKNRNPDRLEQILNSTEISFFSMSRPLICEPDLVKRWLRGDLKKARCISCNKCYDQNGIRCILNAEH